MSLSNASGKQIWLATHNGGKIQEIKELLADLDVEVCSQGEIDFAEIEETGSTYEANALLKAKALWSVVGGVVLADDSGLSVDCLDGAPGLYSARFAGKEANYTTKIEALWDWLKVFPQETWQASFICVLALIDESGMSHTFRGETRGVIVPEKRGGGGFGYDPIFFIPELNQTMAQVPSSLKNKLSHRGKAMAQLMRFLEEHEVWYG